MKNILPWPLSHFHQLKNNVIIIINLYHIFTTLILSHWAWSGTGWLGNPPKSVHLPRGVRFHDFAGSAVVHVAGGIAALVGTIHVGARKGHFTKNSRGKMKAEKTPERYSVPFAVLGGFILFLGFLAFNGGKTFPFCWRNIKDFLRVCSEDCKRRYVYGL